MLCFKMKAKNGSSECCVSHLVIAYTSEQILLELSEGDLL
jgi:hypothetical protein